MVPLFQVSDNYIIGEEVCPKTKKKHLQGYAKFAKKCRPLVKFKEVFPDIYLRKAIAPLMNNYDYCKKEGNFVTNIVPPRIGWKNLEDNSQKILEVILLLRKSELAREYYVAEAILYMMNHTRTHTVLSGQALRDLCKKYYMYMNRYIRPDWLIDPDELRS